ncbi:MAG: hypothetical protein RLZZ562_1168 [Planctomycetota bacterium]
MSPRLRHLTAILLVLVHVLGPALHQVQHALEALRATDSASTLTCSHASCHARAARERAADEVPVAWLDAHERGDHGHDHDCDVCSQLHRLHGYTAAPPADLEAAERLAESLVLSSMPRIERPFCGSARARAPPRTTA